MFYLARAVNADHPCVASKYGQISERGNTRACWPAASSDIHMMTIFEKYILPEKVADYFHLC